jgi:hypothetical protein
MTHPIIVPNFDPYPNNPNISKSENAVQTVVHKGAQKKPLWFGTSGVGQWAVSRRMFMRMRCQTPEGSQAGIWIYSRSQLCNYSILFVHWGPMTSANNCKWRDDVQVSTEPRWLNLVSCALAVAAKASPTSQDIPLVDCGDPKTGAAHLQKMTYHLIGIQNP